MRVRLNGYKNIPAIKAATPEIIPISPSVSLFLNTPPAKSHKRKAKAASTTNPPSTAQLRTCEVESKNLALDKVVFDSAAAPYRSKAKEKFSGPYPKAAFFFNTEPAMLADKLKDGATSTGKSFFKKSKLKLTTIRKTPRTIIVIGNKNFDILNPGFFKLSKAIIVSIPAMATAQSTHQFKTTRTVMAKNIPAVS